MKKNKNFISVAVLFISFIFLFYGMKRGEMTVVLNKAVNICLECIGLG